MVVKFFLFKKIANRKFCSPFSEESLSGFSFQSFLCSFLIGIEKYQFVSHIPGNCLNYADGPQLKMELCPEKHIESTMYKNTFNTFILLAQ